MLICSCGTTVYLADIKIKKGLSIWLSSLLSLLLAAIIIELVFCFLFFLHFIPFLITETVVGVRAEKVNFSYRLVQRCDVY